MAASRFKHVEAIEVRLWDAVVGAVALDRRLGFYVFQYEPRFVAARREVAPLVMPLRLEPWVFAELPVPTYHRLPSLLADALPDDFGNALIDAWMAEQGVTKSAVTTLDRLAYMARRGVGALEFHPARGPKATKSTAVELASLVEVAREAVRGNLDGDEATVALKQLISVGTSAGGARAKAVVAWNPTTNEVRTGQGTLDEGFEPWLLKFDGVGRDRELGGSSDYGRIEYAYSLMARAAGVEMAESRLLEEGGRAHFMTRRFDREGGQKLHMQSLCAMAHLDFRQRATHSYLQYFDVIRQLGLGHEAREEAFRRMLFNVMARNHDDHTKNFAFLLPPDGTWRLAPAFDLSFAFNPNGEWTNQHQLSVNGKFRDITEADFAAVADRVGVGNWRALAKQVKAAVRRWPAFAKKAGLAAKRVREIQAQLRTM